MVPSRIFQIFFRLAIQNQIRISQRVVVNKIVQLRSLRHGHIQRILNPGAAFLPSRSSSSTQPVSMLNLQVLSSYFIIIPSKSCDCLTVYDKVSEFCAVHGSLHCCTRRKRKIRTLLQSETGSDFSCLVGAGGFEPPKLKAADLQSVPIGHSGTRPYSLFVSFAGRLVYSIMQKGFCQLFFYLFLQMRFPCRETAGKALQPCRHGKVGEKSQPEEIDRQIARKTRDNM